MMRMTIDINKTNFYFDKNERPEYLKVVNCKTCHRGEPFPKISIANKLCFDFTLKSLVIYISCNLKYCVNRVITKNP